MDQAWLSLRFVVVASSWTVKALLRRAVVQVTEGKWCASSELLSG